MSGVEVEQAGQEVVAAQVAHQHPPGREDVGGARDHDLPDPELGGERDRVHPAAAAEGDEREVARVVAAVDRDQLERVDHVVVRDPHDAARRLGAIDAEARSAISSSARPTAAMSASISPPQK